MIMFDKCTLRSSGYLYIRWFVVVRYSLRAGYPMTGKHYILTPNNKQHLEFWVNRYGSSKAREINDTINEVANESL